MRLLSVGFGSGAEFLASFSERLAAGGLYCPTRARFAPDEELVIEVAFPGLPSRTMLRGRAHSRSIGEGGWVALDPGEAPARDYLLAAARGAGSDDASERGHRRIPAALPVACRIDELDEPRPDQVHGRTLDVGGGGLFVRSASAPSVGTRVEVVLGPTADSGARFHLDARVAWTRTSHDAARGFGVRFERGCDDARRLRAMLRRAWERGRVEFAP
jgi:Tfp pilus assembly protein PilZ